MGEWMTDKATEELLTEIATKKSKEKALKDIMQRSGYVNLLPCPICKADATLNMLSPAFYKSEYIVCTNGHRFMLDSNNCNNIVTEYNNRQ